MAAAVTYKKGVTVNTGNFESERFEVMITRECEDNDMDIRQCYEHLKVYVDQEIGKCVDETKGNKANSSSQSVKKSNMDDLMI